MVERLREVFPNLGVFQITSPPSEKYNCISWATGDAAQWWWPEETPDTFWPEQILKEETITRFAEVFAFLGYTQCLAGNYESGFEKIALFADTAGTPLQAARQLPSGRWTSKLGRAEDIEHELYDLEGGVYGKVMLIMRRPII